MRFWPNLEELSFSKKSVFDCQKKCFSLEFLFYKN